MLKDYMHLTVWKSDRGGGRGRAGIGDLSDLESEPFHTGSVEGWKNTTFQLPLGSEILFFYRDRYI